MGALTVEEVNDYTVQLFGARDRDELLGPTHWLWEKSIDTFRRALESRWRGEEFFQETTKDGGMGMGLRICRAVIEAHGGRIAAV